MKISFSQRFIGFLGGSIRFRLSSASELCSSVSSVEKATEGVVICRPMVSGMMTPLSSANSVCRMTVPNESITATTATAFSKGVK